MLKRFLLIHFIFFNLFLLQSEERLEHTVDEWENIKGKEVALFVNNTNKSQKKADGSKKAPFKKIEDAFTHLSGLKRKDIKATIYITGNFTSKNVYVITVPTKIVGFDDYSAKGSGKLTSSCISFEKNAGFVVASSQLNIEKCTISRREFVDEPRSVPLLYSSNSTINMKNVSLSAKEGGSIFRFIESNVLMEMANINSTQNGYCNIIEAIKSNVKIKNSHFNCRGRFVISIDSSSSIFDIDGLYCNIIAHLFAIALKTNDGKINMQNSFLLAEGKYANVDEAIVYSAKTELSIKDIELKGFTSEAKLKKD